MRKALYFEDALDFCDFVRLCGPDTKPAADGRAFELCRVHHPGRPGESALVLFHCKPPLERGLRRILTLIDAEVDLGEETLYWNLEGSASSPLTGRTRGESLLELIELRPWKQNGARHPAATGPVLFWIAGAGEDRAEMLARLVRDSLRLGNDRIQYGPIESGKDEATLLRIESPSFFLIQACQEDFGGAVELFYPAGEACFVRWGFSHPLESWWDRAPSGPSEKWLFFRGGTEYVHADPVAWQDAYHLAEISLDFSHREIWVESPGAPPRFEVPLALERTLSAPEPELWLLDESGVRRLEATLQVTDEESLRSWQIAVQRSEKDESDWIFIRENHAGKQRRHHDFAGVGFARYQGLNNLYLPVGFELQPPLRRDAYRNLFQLQPDALTVVVPDEAGGFQILRVREKAFDGLSSLVDYIVQRDADELKNLMAASLFDFGQYLKAPKHPGLTPGTGQADAKERQATPIPEGLGEVAEPSDAAAEDPESNVLADRLKIGDVSFDETQLGEVQQEELRLEREIIASGQVVERWTDLMGIKGRLEKHSDAILCAIEALWIASDAKKRDWLLGTLANLAESEFVSGGDPAAVGFDEPESQRRAATFALVGRCPAVAGELDQWIGEMTAFLRIHEDGLRAKERWLAWGAVLGANRDLRRETQLREEIRNRITERGLSLEETPAFIRSRIFLDRGEFDGGEESGANAAVGLSNLEELRAAGLAFDSPRLRQALRAVLARECSDLGDLAPAEELAEVRKEETDQSLAAWEIGMLIISFQKQNPIAAQSLEPEYTQRLDEVDPDTARAIRELREFYDAKAEADSPAAFLARENRGRTYPRGTGTESGLLYELSMDLERQSLAGNELGAVQVMRAMMNIGDVSEYDDPVKLPQFIETLVAGLERFKWGERGAGLVPIFESFSDRVPGFLSSQQNDFYGAILHSNLALGLLTVENLERALGNLRLAAEAAAGNTIELDFIDSAAAVIRTVEQLPLGYRAPFLETLMKGFADHFDVENSPYVANDRLFAVLVKFLNQMTEAASSKDRLSLQQFRHYQLQDEFLILQRIQSESFCDPESNPVNPG